MLAATNSVHMLEALLAICDAGCIASPVNHRWSPAELAAAMQLVQPAVVIADEGCWGLVQKAMDVDEAMRERISDRMGVRVLLLGGNSSGSDLRKGTDHVMSTEGLIKAGERVMCTQMSDKKKRSSNIQECGLGQIEGSGVDRIVRHVPLQLRKPESGAAIICFTSGTTGVCCFLYSCLVRLYFACLLCVCLSLLCCQRQIRGIEAKHTRTLSLI